MSKTKSKPTMTEVLKAAIQQSGISRYRISQDTGILETSLSRFMRGETSLRLDKADVLAEYLGLELGERQGKGFAARRGGEQVYQDQERTRK